MRKLLLSIVAAIVLPLSGLNIASAQDDGPPQFRPVELWACTFRDGKDQGDMDDVYDDLRKITADSPYAAWQLNPYFVGNLLDQFDFIYLGAWTDGKAMGADLEHYLANSAAVGVAWNETVECASTMYASTRIEAPSDDDGTGSFVLTVSDCKVEDGRTSAQAMGAMNRFNQYRVANGMTIPTLAWFPVFGGGNAEFDYKLVSVFPNVTAVGNWFQWTVDNAAYRVSGEMTEGLVDCDEARMYLGNTIMNNLNQ
jgi:hypothetical protein